MNLELVFTLLVWPLFAIGVYTYFIVLNLEKTKSWLFKGKRRLAQENISFMLDGLKLKRGNWLSLIALPALAATGLGLLLAFLFNQPLKHWDLPFLSLALTTGFLGPISEEIAFRGMFLSSLLLALDSKDKPQKFAIAVAVVALSVVFAFLHTQNFDFASYAFQTRFWASMLFSVVYLQAKRNLFASVSAHLASNWLLILFGSA